MKRILALEGSPRHNGNSSVMLEEFCKAAAGSGASIRKVNTEEINITPCMGCLRCNLLKRCSVRRDDWAELSRDILDSDVIVLSSPVYFFGFPSGLKRVIDRFRSFIHVRITADSLVHTPWEEWNKTFVLLLSMGSPDPGESRHIVEMMRFIVRELGEKNDLNIFSGVRLAVRGQIRYGRSDLEELYRKLKIPAGLAGTDHQRNVRLLGDIGRLGDQLGRDNG